MSRGALVVLALVLAAAVAWLVWFDRPGEEIAEERPRLADLAQDRVIGLDLAGGAERIALQREGAVSWRLTSPMEREADPRKVETLLSAVSSAVVEEVVRDETDDPSAFGLEPAVRTLTLTLEGDARPLILAMGDESPVGFRRYARVADGPVVLVAGSLFTAVDREASDFLERRFVPANPAEVVKISRSGGPGDFALLLEEGRWKVVAPVQDLADLKRADSLVRVLTSLEAVWFAPEPIPAEIRAAFDDPPTRFEVEVGGGQDVRVVEIGGDAGPSHRWARRAVGEFYGVVSKVSHTDLDRPTDEFRERGLVFLSRHDVTELRFRDGERWTSLHRQEGSASWIIDDGSGKVKETPSTRVEQVLDRLRWIKAESFLEDPEETPVTVREFVVVGKDGELGRVAAESAPGTRDEEIIRVHSSWRPGRVFGVSAVVLAELPANAGEVAVESTAGGS